MVGSLVHRGPDDDGFYFDQHIALGHRRLSIIDINGGKQPLSNEDGTIQLVCNGEIYNSPALRKDLEQRGHRFKTATDVEVILHLFEEDGIDCVRKLKGMFAFAIWDTRSQTLHLARDHMGQKPLFYKMQGDTFLFASEPKAILQAEPGKTPNIDLVGLSHYISFRYFHGTHTMFDGIHKLQAATTLTYRHGNLRTNRYWVPDFRDKFQVSEADIIDQLDELTTRIVKEHTLSDVTVGAMVSGGIDSSTVAAIMCKQQSNPIPAFSIGVREQSFNELPFAKMVTDKYAMEAHQEVVSADLVQLMPSMIHAMDEPSDPFSVGVYLASRLASQHVKVALSGDGGDECYAGYDRYVGQQYLKLYGLLPTFLRRHLIGPAISLIPESFGYKSLAQKAAWMNDLSFYTEGERYAYSLAYLRFLPAAKRELFTAQANESLDYDNPIEDVLRFHNADNVEESVDRMLYTDLMTRMPDHLLAIGDRMSMAHSLELRPVMVDREFVEFAAKVPARLKLKNRELKYVLRRVAERHLPNKLVNRPKQGFSFPIAQWMRTELRGVVENFLIHDSRFVQAGIFNPEYMSKIVNEHLTGKTDHNYRLWILLNLEYWYRMYMEGLSIDSAAELTQSVM